MTIHTIEVTAAVTLKSTLEYLQLFNDYCVFKLDRGLTPEQDVPYAFHYLPTVGSAAIEGISRWTDILAFIEGRANSIVTADQMWLVLPSFENTILNKGWDITHCRILHPFTALTTGAASVDQLMHINFANHTAFNRYGRILPSGIVYNYIDGQFTEDRYDLPKALAILKEHPQVTLKSNTIQDIPYYNSEPGRTQFLAFKFKPTLDEANELWQLQCELSPSSPTIAKYLAMARLDLLGLKSGGAVKDLSDN